MEPGYFFAFFFSNYLLPKYSDFMNSNNCIRKYKLFTNTNLIFPLLQLMEPAVTVRCRQADLSLVQAAAPKAVAEYTAMSGLPCAVQVDTANFLPATM